MCTDYLIILDATVGWHEKMQKYQRGRKYENVQNEDIKNCITFVWNPGVKPVRCVVPPGIKATVTHSDDTNMQIACLQFAAGQPCMILGEKKLTLLF